MYSPGLFGRKLTVPTANADCDPVKTPGSRQFGVHFSLGFTNSHFTHASDYNPHGAIVPPMTKMGKPGAVRGHRNWCGAILRLLCPFNGQSGSGQVVAAAALTECPCLLAKY
jgi:hypothetical protein